MAGHSRNPGYRAGNHWAECPRCGLDYRAGLFKEEWNGLWVCKWCYEPRHPQDFVRGHPDKINPEDPVWPPQDDDFVSVDFADATSEVKSGTFNEDTL